MKTSAEIYSGSEMIVGQLNAIQRILGYKLPQDYDDWGFHQVTGEKWEHTFCIIDDFGDAVPYNPWPYHLEDCCAVLDFLNGPNYELVYPVHH